MLQKTALLASVLLGSAFFFSCETVVEVPIPKHEPKLAVRYMLPDQPADELLYQLFPQYQPYVNHSQDIYSGSDLNGVLNAELTIKDAQGNVVETFKRSDGSGIGASDDGYYEPVSGFQAQPGQTYTFTVSSPDYPSVNSKVTMPLGVSGLQADFQQSDYYVEPAGNYATVKGRINVSLPDNGSENNYYLLYGVLLDQNGKAQGRDSFQEDRDENSGVQVGAEFQDIHFSPIHYGSVNPFDDKTFNGRTISFGRNANLFYGRADMPPTHLRIYVHSITEGAYKFLKSLKLYNENGNNPFAEQTRVIGNINNGYGFFGGFTSNYVDIPLPQ